MLKDEAFAKRRREVVLQVVVPAHTQAGRWDLAALSKRQRMRQGVWNVLGHGQPGQRVSRGGTCLCPDVCLGKLVEVGWRGRGARKKSESQPRDI